MKRFSNLKTISVLLTLTMLVGMLGMFAIPASAAAATWTDNADTSWFVAADGSPVTGAANVQSAYYLTTPAQVGGLAKLTDQAAVKTTSEAWPQGYLAGVTIYLTADMDFAQYVWGGIGCKNGTANANSNAICANIIGAKGKTATSTATTYERVTLSNMTGRSTNKNFALIGCYGGGTIANLNFNNINFSSTSNTVGTLVGYAKSVGGATATFKDITVTNATMTIAGEAVGGLVGNTNLNATFDNCVYVGTVTSTIASGDNAHAGGISGTCNTVNITVNNCYVAARINAHKRAGGITGYVRNLTVTDSMFEVIVDGIGTQTGLLVGRYDMATNSIMSMTNVLALGINGNGYNNARSYTWIGLTANSVAGAASFNNCYGNATIPFMAANDYAAETPQEMTLTLNGQTLEKITSTNNGEYGEYTVPMWNTAAMKTAGFDFEGEDALWVERADGLAPILKNAQGLYDNPYAKADLSWYDVDAATNDEFVISTYEQALGLALISQVEDYPETAYIHKIDRGTLSTFPPEELFAEGFFEATAEKWQEVIVVDEYTTVNAKLLKVYYQVASGVTADSANATFRLVAATDSLGTYQSVGFRVWIGGTEKTPLDTKTVYAAVQAGDDVVTPDTVYGEDAKYFFLGGVSNIPAADYDKTITVRAYFTMLDGTEVLGPEYTMTVRDMLPAANAQ